MDSGEELDRYTVALLEHLQQPEQGTVQPPDDGLRDRIAGLRARTREEKEKTAPLVDLFVALKEARETKGLTPEEFGIGRDELLELARRHQRLDEHFVSIGGRVDRALPLVSRANLRVDEYLARHRHEAPSGIELRDSIRENRRRIQRALGMDDDEWHSYKGQLRHVISSVDELARLIDLSPSAVRDVTRVTENYRMRLTPYYTSLIMPGKVNDPIMLQAVPTGEMLDNGGIEIPPVAADHSPARLVDQFYPRTLTIKSTNMCAMYCTHCLRIAHIGRKDRIFSKQAYGEALDYIRRNQRIRDVLITGGDAFVLPNAMIRRLLDELDDIDHVRVKRLGTRIPVTAPMRVDDELLDILEASNERGPVRVVTQINTAREITPESRRAFYLLSRRVSALLNQAVLLKGINDSRIKMWKLCETVQEAHVRPYYIFNCSYRNPQFTHFRVPLERGRDIVESMYGNISGDAIPRFIATAGGKIPMHRSNVVERRGNTFLLRKPWNGEEVEYPDADPDLYADSRFSFAAYEVEE